MSELRVIAAMSVEPQAAVSSIVSNGVERSMSAPMLMFVSRVWSNRNSTNVTRGGSR
jgi:hypothetical protein